MRPRIIPCLLLKNNGLVKTIKFKDPKYVGDPINCIRIFNDKEVDELVFLDIDASRLSRKPDFKLIEKLAGECFMPFAYGGGINSLEHILQLNKIGVEKVILSSKALNDLDFLEEAVNRFGSSTIVVCLDIKKNFWGNYTVYTHNATRKFDMDLSELIGHLNRISIGELIVNSIDRDGTMQGYDQELLGKVAKLADMPVVALGGAGNISHMKEVTDAAGISAVAAGSMFVFHGKHKAVLITYLNQSELTKIFK